MAFEARVRRTGGDWLLYCSLLLHLRHFVTWGMMHCLNHVAVFDSNNYHGLHQMPLCE